MNIGAIGCFLLVMLAAMGGVKAWLVKQIVRLEIVMRFMALAFLLPLPLLFVRWGVVWREIADAYEGITRGAVRLAVSFKAGHIPGRGKRSNRKADPSAAP